MTVCRSRTVFSTLGTSPSIRACQPPSYVGRHAPWRSTQRSTQSVITGPNWRSSLAATSTIILIRVLRALMARLSLCTSSSAYCLDPPITMFPVYAPEQETLYVTSAGIPVRWMAESGERWHQLSGPLVPASYVPTPSPEISLSPSEISPVLRSASGRSAGSPYSRVASAARMASSSGGRGWML